MFSIFFREKKKIEERAESQKANEAITKCLGEYQHAGQQSEFISATSAMGSHVLVVIFYRVVIKIQLNFTIFQFSCIYPLATAYVYFQKNNKTERDYTFSSSGLCFQFIWSSINCKKMPQTNVSCYLFANTTISGFALIIAFDYLCQELLTIRYMQLVQDE